MAHMWFKLTTGKALFDTNWAPKTLIQPVAHTFLLHFLFYA